MSGRCTSDMYTRAHAREAHQRHHATAGHVQRWPIPTLGGTAQRAHVRHTTPRKVRSVAPPSLSPLRGPPMRMARWSRSCWRPMHAGCVPLPWPGLLEMSHCRSSVASGRRRTQGQGCHIDHPEIARAAPRHGTAARFRGRPRCPRPAARRRGRRTRGQYLRLRVAVGVAGQAGKVAKTRP